MFEYPLQNLDELPQSLVMDTPVIFSNVDKNSPIASFCLEKTKDAEDNVIICLSVLYQDASSDSCSIDEHGHVLNLFRVVTRANQQDTIDQRFIRYLEWLLVARLPVHPLFSTIFEKPLKQVLDETIISRDLYDDSSPLYHQHLENNEQSQLNLNLIKKQFESCINILSQWVEKNKVKPSRENSTSNEILAVFKARITSDFFHKQRALIYGELKCEFEGLLLALSAPDIAETSKRRVIANLLDNLDMCSDGVCFAIDDNYQSLYKVGAKGYLAEARKEIAKQVALELLTPYLQGDDPDIWPGNVLHYVHAFLANVEHVLAITLAEDTSSVKDINLVLFEKFRELLCQQLTPTHLLSHLVQQLLPKIDGANPQWIENELALFGMDDLGLEKQLVNSSCKEVLLKHSLLRRLFSADYFDKNQIKTMADYEKNYQIDYVEIEPFLTQIILFVPDDTTVDAIYFLEEFLFLPKNALKLDKSALAREHLQEIYDAANITLSFENLQRLLDAGIPVEIITSSPNYSSFVSSLYQLDHSGNHGLIQSIWAPDCNVSSLISVLEKTDNGQRVLLTLVDNLFLLYLTAASYESHFLRLIDAIFLIKGGEKFLVDLIKKTPLLTETMIKYYNANTLKIILERWISLSIPLNEKKLLDGLLNNKQISGEEFIAISSIIQSPSKKMSEWIGLLSQVDEVGRNRLSNDRDPVDLIKNLSNTVLGRKGLIKLVLSTDKEGKNALYWMVCSENKKAALYLVDVLTVDYDGREAFVKAVTQKTIQGASAISYAAYYCHDKGKLFIKLISNLLKSRTGIAAINSLSWEANERQNIFAIAAKFQIKDVLKELIQQCDAQGVFLNKSAGMIIHTNRFFLPLSIWTAAKTKAFEELSHYGLTVQLLHYWEAPKAPNNYFLLAHKKALVSLVIDYEVGIKEAMKQINCLNVWQVQALSVLYLNGLRGEHLREYQLIKKTAFEQNDFTYFVESIDNQGLSPELVLAQVRPEQEEPLGYSLSI